MNAESWIRLCPAFHHMNKAEDPRRRVAIILREAEVYGSKYYYIGADRRVQHFPDPQRL